MIRAASLAAMLIVPSGCGSTGSHSAEVRSKPSIPPVTASSSTDPITPSASRPHREGLASGGAEYQAAKRQWLGSGLYGGSAGQNAALPIAINDLKVGESTDRGSKGGYPGAIAALVTIEQMPDAMVTPEESAEWDAAAATLDRFFDLTSGDPYNVECSPASNTPAAVAWNDEPIGITSGVLVQPLKEAAADLEPQAATNPCIRAAVDDLVALVSATRPMIEATAEASYTSDSSVLAMACEIGYLNQVFEPGALDPSQDRLVSLSR